MLEARDYRCCMCPQADTDMHICPTGPGKTSETQCDFVVVWMDQRGWKYKVMGDLAGTFKGRYQENRHSGDLCWHGMRQMQRRERFDQAQEDLNRYAKSKGWQPLPEPYQPKGEQGTCETCRRSGQGRYQPDADTPYCTKPEEGADACPPFAAGSCGEDH